MLQLQDTMKLKYFFLVGAILMAIVYVWWSFSGAFLLDLPNEDMRLYQIRRELPLIEAILLYIAWRLTP